MTEIRLLMIICILLYAFGTMAFDLVVEPANVTPGGTITIRWIAQPEEGNQATLTVDTTSLITLVDLFPTGSTEITIHTHAPINTHKLEGPSSLFLSPVTFTVELPSTSPSSTTDAPSLPTLPPDLTVTPPTMTSSILVLSAIDTSSTSTQSTTVPNSSATNNSTPSTSGLSKKVTVAVIIVGVLLAATITTISIMFCKRKRAARRPLETPPTPGHLEPFTDKDLSGSSQELSVQQTRVPRRDRDAGPLFIQEDSRSESDGSATLPPEYGEVFHGSNDDVPPVPSLAPRDRPNKLLR